MHSFVVPVICAHRAYKQSSEKLALGSGLRKQQRPVHTIVLSLRVSHPCLCNHALSAQLQFTIHSTMLLDFLSSLVTESDTSGGTIVCYNRNVCISLNCHYQCHFDTLLQYHLLKHNFLHSNLLDDR